MPKPETDGEAKVSEAKLLLGKPLADYAQSRGGNYINVIYWMSWMRKAWIDSVIDLCQLYERRD